MAVISIGDGRLIELEEGALRALPPVPPAPKPPVKPRDKKRKSPRDKSVTIRGFRFKSDPRKNHVKKVAPNEIMDAIPGFREWAIRRSTQIHTIKAGMGKPLGRADGIPKYSSDAIWAEARRKAKRDMEKIRAKIDLEDAAAEALLASLETMRSPMSQQVKLAAAKMVLDFTMAKPIAKSEVTVNAAEAWLASIGTNDD